MADNILEVRGLKKYFNPPHGLLHAVDDLSFNIEKGKTLGVVGESGCGKSSEGSYSGLSTAPKAKCCSRERMSSSIPRRR